MKFVAVGSLVLLALACGAPGPQAVPVAEATGACPQKRATPSAPPDFQQQANPAPASALETGRKLYQETAKPFSCKTCHGANGDGLGDPDFESTPPARNFTCAPTMNALSNGQLFWIIRNGSPQTAMPAHPGLSEDDIWSLVRYLRTFSGGS